MFCARCGNKMIDGARFCSNCGYQSDMNELPLRQEFNDTVPVSEKKTKKRSKASFFVG